MHKFLKDQSNFSKRIEKRREEILNEKTEKTNQTNSGKPQVDKNSEELSKIQDDLIQKKAEFETFNIKLENSFITEKDKKIEYLEKNIKDIEKKLAQEQIENENLKKEIQILKKEKEEQMKINKENELEIKSLNKSKKNLSMNLHVSEKRIEFEKNHLVF